MEKEIKEKIISHLSMLKTAYEEEIIPTMIDSGDHEERIEELNTLLSKLNNENNENI